MKHRKNNALRVFPLLSIFASTSCATLQLSTEPAGAEIVVVSTSGGNSTPLGKSPVSLNTKQLSEILKEGPALVRVNAEGYEAASILLPTSLRGDLKASLVLKKIIDKDNIEKKNSEMNTLVREILDAERGIIEKRFDDAQRISTKIREKYPSLAISYFLEGSIQFQKGDLQAAVASLSRGLDLDPDDTVTKNFVEQIKKGPAEQPKK